MTLRQLIYQTISGITLVTYDHFPDQFDSSTHTGLIFFINNPDNRNSFDAKEIVKRYNVDVIIRSPLLDNIETVKDNLKPAIYSLEETEYISYVSLISEEQPFYNSQLKTWESFLSFDLTA